MSRFSSVHTISASPAWADAVGGILGDGGEAFASAEAFRAAGVMAAGGLLVLGPDVPASEAASLAEAVAESGGSWILLRGGEADGEGDVLVSPVALPASCTFSLADLAGRLRRTDVPPPPLELGQILSFVARARHDINNPLTSALAETQLLLLDAEDAEVRAGLEIVEEQLRRIRDLVARLQALPRPRSLG